MATISGLLGDSRHINNPSETQPFVQTSTGLVRNLFCLLGALGDGGGLTLQYQLSLGGNSEASAQVSAEHILSGALWGSQRVISPALQCGELPQCSTYSRGPQPPGSQAWASEVELI